ncbi:hypothetical protein PIB30_036222 [Stylosanthes scabra]|uniref:Uncharacterized protein n=1 Tax=Stylosanthes scabra TaxID=79078 RepID=A0ABU6UCQ7_9FABA|nr:hypothetical protein [Stylosanthes scabra]
MEQAKIGAEVAKEGARNEEITKKSLEANSDAYVYAPMVTCIRIAKTWASRLSWNRTLCDLQIGANSTTRPFDSSGLLRLDILAKSLVDIASMLKEIKEGQQPIPRILKRQPDAPQQTPVKHCGICACNSHHTDECPQLQEDNTVASTHNFFEGTTIRPYNKQYYTQGWRDNQPTR